jgi:hypothetical protein
MNEMTTTHAFEPREAAVPQAISVTDGTANPAPLGLLAFGLTTVMLSMHNAGLFGLDAMILAMAVFYGGIAQIFAGVFEWRKNNTFAATAFTSYGFFWLTLAGIITFPTLGLAAAPSQTAMAAYLGIWGFFTLVMFIGTLRLNRALQIVFGLLTLAFALLAVGDLIGSSTLKTIAGWEGILLGFCAIYTGLAQVLNDVYGRVVLPLGPVAK